MPTIHFDLTDVLEYARHNTTLSGIQTMLVRVLNEMVDAYGQERIRLIGYHPNLKRLVSWEPSYFAGPFKYEHSDFCSRFGLTTADVPTLREFVESKYGRRYAGFHSARLRVKNVLTGGRALRRHGIALSTAMRRPPPLPDDAESCFVSGDVVFAGGGTWGVRPMINELIRLKRTRGIKLYFFIHDLIPLLAPEHVDHVNLHVFEDWLRLIAEHGDLFLTNSVSTKSDLLAWFADNGVNIPTRVVRLAHQFADWPRSAVPDHPQVHVRNDARLPYVLCVGTIESRKNVWTLANVWREIHAKLGTATPRLLFAGKPGWAKNDFDDFMRGTGSLYGYIRIVDRPSDGDLAFLYRNCLFSIFPSYKEGWGLPIGESLWFGRPVICSSTSSMPEVGGSLADYVDPYDPQAIEKAILKMITDPAYREKRASEVATTRLRSWADVADDLWATLIDNQSAVLPAGAPAPAPVIRESL
jgi:glycosyltransferase involved in cell wall biosynthesis